MEIYRYAKVLPDSESVIHGKSLFLELASKHKDNYKLDIGTK